jgi:hypothetical protein
MQEALFFFVIWFHISLQHEQDGWLFEMERTRDVTAGSFSWDRHRRRSIPSALVTGGTRSGGTPIAVIRWDARVPAV